MGSGSRRSGNPPEWKSPKASQKRNAIGVELDEVTLEIKDCGSEEEVTCPRSAKSADWKDGGEVTCHLCTERKARSCAARRLEDACNGKSRKASEASFRVGGMTRKKVKVAEGVTEGGTPYL